MRLPLALVPLLLPCLPAQELDLQQVADDLEAIFERPAGTTIPPEAQDKFRAFLAKYQGVDLGPFSYAPALYKYLLWDYEGAAADLDAFFAAHHGIENPEHSMMAGRVYLNAINGETKKPVQDSAKLNRWAESTARLYPDTRVLVTYLGRLLDDGSITDPVGFRVALCSGVVRSSVDVRAKDALIRAVYAERR